MKKNRDNHGIARWKIILISITIVLALLLIGLFVIMQHYQVKTVTVTGNQHYTEDEIKDMVLDGRFGHNSLYLYLKYRNKSIKNVPFIETMDVTIVSPSEINITVYEKAIAGYVEYLGRYMYFDKDGIVVEASESKTKDIPYVTGLSFDHVVLYEKLPVEKEEIFKTILNITQLLSKYQISTDRIFFDSDMNITLYFGDTRVELGNTDNIDEKMIKLQYIIPELEGLSGTLYMENYSQESEDDYITFQRDDISEHKEVISENNFPYKVSHLSLLIQE